MNQSQSPSWSLLRVLCLHDAHSNSIELSIKLNSLGEKLYRNHGIDLVFVDAPLIVDHKDIDRDGEGNSDSAREQNSRRIDEHPPRAWWEEDRRSNPDEPSSGEENINPNITPSTSLDGGPPPNYVGLDASLLLLKQVWTSSPFWGILAFGQAAGVASLLPLLPNHGKNEGQAQPPSFAIFVNGETLLDEEESLTEHLQLPCLHVVDDPYITREEPLPATARSNTTQRLVRQFGGSVVCDESLSQVQMNMPYSSIFNNHVGRFLVAQKRRLRKNVGDIAILALRHELYRTEADAAQLVAKQIAENPPEALMAVITPKNVGGFRDKRRGPGEEGGGAPCPSEFLLHRTKRSASKNQQATESPSVERNENPSSGRDASRSHPNQQNESQKQTNEP